MTAITTNVGIPNAATPNELVPTPSPPRRLAKLETRVQRAVGMAQAAGGAFAWAPPLMARVTVGWVFVSSGWGKLHNLEGVTSFFGQLGIPAPALNAALASTTELVCGSLLLAGLATRFAALPLMVVMAVAIRTALWDRFESASGLFGLAEFGYVVLLGWLAGHGAGALSFDRLIERVWRRRGSS